MTGAVLVTDDLDHGRRKQISVAEFMRTEVYPEIGQLIGANGANTVMRDMLFEQRPELKRLFLVGPSQD